MSDVAPSAATYRLLDVGSKLLGVALVAAGLHAGGSTALGIGLATAGVVLGTATVFIRRQP